jgi:adenosylcobyric acid synthase
LERLTGVPVAGIVPYLRLDLDDEDSLSERLETHSKGGLCEIGVIRLPHLSNFTDFNALDALDGVDVRYLERVEQWGNPDCVILPGTKNTMADLKWLRESGLETMLLRHAERGGLVIGICGGYQMLGEQLNDPDGLEEGGSMRGIGLLPARTVFEGEKVRTRVQGTFDALSGAFAPLSGRAVEGYEIHMGRTEALDSIQTAVLLGEKSDGMVRNNVLGCYLHGLFDTAEAAEGLAGLLLNRKGIDPNRIHAPDRKSYREQQYDLLAEGMQRALDMKLIMKILEEGVAI